MPYPNVIPFKVVVSILLYKLYNDVCCVMFKLNFQMNIMSNGKEFRKVVFVLISTVFLFCTNKIYKRYVRQNHFNDTCTILYLFRLLRSYVLSKLILYHSIKWLIYQAGN